MNYLITFDDGSSAFLMHYGIRGMRWGRWNPETQARYRSMGKLSGGGGYVKEEDDESDSEENQNKKEITVGNTPNMSRLYTQEAYDKGSEYTKQEWNNFVSDMSNRGNRLSNQAQEIANNAKQYADDVVSTGTRFGTDTGNAANHVSKVADDIVNLRFSTLEEDFGKASSSVSSAVKSGSDYISALFGQYRR